MPDWNAVALPRADKVIHGLAVLAKTARRDYDVDPELARLMLDGIDEALAALRAAYAPRLGESIDTPAEPAPEAPAPAGAPVMLDRAARDPRGVAAFVEQIPAGHLPDWALHVTRRVMDAAYGDR